MAKCPNFLPYDHHPDLASPAEHEDDSYGGCIICMFYVPHTDEEFERAAFPCAVVREANARRDVLAELLSLIPDGGMMADEVKRIIKNMRHGE